MSIKKLLIISYFFIIFGILILGMLSILLVQNDKALAAKQEQRYQSNLLADQLRQSSDDLTRLARTYVVTGDAQYENMYWDILAIRNGEKARPQHYDRIYWDLVLTYGDKPRPDGETISLQELMKRTGFTEAEFAKLREAQNNSDGLVTTETIAMNAVKGLYDDGTGNYVKKGEPDFEMARRIMHDVQYHQDKAAIMKPIDEFFELLDERTKGLVQYHAKKADFLFFLIQIVVLLLIVFSVLIGIFVTKQILKQVGGEPTKIARMTKQVASGQLDVQFESQSATGIYADVQTMVNNLKLVIKDIIQVSEGLAKGNLRVTPQAEYQGNFVQIKNALETALSNQQRVVEDIVQVSQGLAAGKHVIAHAEYQGDFVQIKETLETASLKLAEATAQNVKQDWLKTGQAQLSELMSGEQEMTELAKRIITFLTTYVDAQVGLFYLLTDGDSLQVIASYAYSDNLSNQFKVGEGLVGEAALEQKMLIRTHTPEEFKHITQSGVVMAIPRHVIIIPFLYEKSVKGVIEIGFSNQESTKLQQDFIQQVMPSLGIAINTAQSRNQMQRLLKGDD